MQRHPIQTALPMVLFFILQVSAQTDPEPVVPKSADTSVSSLRSIPGSRKTDSPFQTSLGQAPTVAKAYLWSLGGTTALCILPGTLSGGNLTAGIAGVSSGLILGPSFGQFYAGSYAKGSYGALLRIAGAGIMALGGEYSSTPLLLAGLVVYVGGASYSMADIRPAVARAREKARHQVAPMQINSFASRSDSGDANMSSMDDPAKSATDLSPLHYDSYEKNSQRMAIGFAASGVGGALYAAALFTSGFGFDPNPTSDLLGYTGLTLFAGGAIYGIYCLVNGFGMNHTEENSNATNAIRFDLFPTLSRTANGGLGAGMMARVGF